MPLHQFSQHKTAGSLRQSFAGRKTWVNEPLLGVGRYWHLLEGPSSPREGQTRGHSTSHLSTAAFGRSPVALNPPLRQKSALWCPWDPMGHGQCRRCRSCHAQLEQEQSLALNLLSWELTPPLHTSFGELFCRRWGVLPKEFGCYLGINCESKSVY